jgi:hypothetical protein
VSQPDKQQSPSGDVTYDEKALEEAERRMHAQGTGDEDVLDPEGGHDPEALRDAARKMGVDRR